MLNTCRIAMIVLVKCNLTAESKQSYHAKYNATHNLLRGIMARIELVWSFNANNVHLFLLNFGQNSILQSTEVSYLYI